MSPISIYKKVASGPNSGSTIPGNLRQLTNVGVLPVNNSAGKEALSKMGLSTSHVMPSTGFYTPYPSGWEETAGYFACVEAFDIRSFDGLISALLNDFPVVYGRSGHAICGVAPYQSGGYGIEYANSWGAWGDQGYGRDTEQFVSSSIFSYGAWALRAVRITNNARKLCPYCTAA